MASCDATIPFPTERVPTIEVRSRPGAEIGCERLTKWERGALGPLAGRPYRRLGMSPAPTPRARPAVQVEKRSLRDYAAVAR